MVDTISSRPKPSVEALRNRAGDVELVDVIERGFERRKIVRRLALFHLQARYTIMVCRQAAPPSRRAKRRRCAWHGHWIGGESPSRGEVVATASWRQLHAVPAVVRRQRWRREAVW